ncbi:DUF4982 domain-containing protein [Sphingomonas pituitosa]|uniref:DUF4982 domain-containing protein n=1 Tax=Sphingomonas pituitosa TaxID=99597 RepID=UPI000A0771CD|nr:DUF4982 domain-containing protein [Sphingomonas pituitosa]
MHILPHWTFQGRGGQFTPIHAFSSADEAELFVNGKSRGRRRDRHRRSDQPCDSVIALRDVANV